MIPFKPPVFKFEAFSCPHCGVFANQLWDKPLVIQSDNTRSYMADFDIAHCKQCNNYSLWREENMLFPTSGTVPLPNEDMPDDIKRDYNEARSILEISPRGAAALLRLAIQKSCVFLGEKGKNLNADISNLVKKNLPVKVQKSLDYVRVVGNNAVHPGTIDMKDNKEIAEKLFDLVNLITEVMISQPKHVDELYESLPDDSKKQIEKRDASKA